MQHCTRASISELSGLACVLLLVTAVRSLLGAIGVADLVVSAVAVIGANVTPDLTGSNAAFTGSTVFAVWLVAATANLAPRVVGHALVYSTAAFLLISWFAGTQSWTSVLDAAVFNVAMCIAEMAFLRVLVRSSRTQDVLTEEMTALEIGAALWNLQQASSATVRRVLHDEVISALRAVAELPPERHDQVLNASRRAVLAVQQNMAQA